MRDLLAIVGALLLLGFAVGMISKIMWWAVLGGGMYLGYKAIISATQKTINKSSKYNFSNIILFNNTTDLCMYRIFLLASILIPSFSDFRYLDLLFF